MLFGVNLGDLTGEILYNEGSDNKFLFSVRKVLKLLQIDETGSYSKIFTNNIHSIAAEIEINLDEVLENLKIPFRTEEFLLILFQELYEQFIHSSE
ncbi:MAG: hypothetical protein GY870_21575 [archaeon]|nr:hypothetical protein [archaeon]